jgi:transmembrane sensor
MAPQTASTPINTQIYEEAADWLVRNREHELNEAARKSFDLWLRISPQHIRAYLELSALWEDLSLLEPCSDASSAHLDARSRAYENVVSLECRARESDKPASIAGDVLGRASPTARRQRWRFRIAASLLVLATATAFVTWTTREPGYSTEIGEQRTIKLADGSIVELNSASRLRIHFTSKQRSVELMQGQALFQVAKERARPFVVSAGGARVRAVGTEFDVYQKQAATVVTVLEGQVAIVPQSVYPDSAASSASSLTKPPGADRDTGVDGELRTKDTSPIVLSAGQQLTVTHDAVKETPRADLAAATAWTQHHIVFTDAPLNEVAEEFNRYNTRRVIIADPELETFGINGVFSSADPSVLVRFLRQQGDIEVEESDTAIRISHR